MEDETKAQHPTPVNLSPGNRAVVPPIYQSVKFTVDRYADLSRRDFFFYSRVSNPTVATLEGELKALQEKEECLCLGSGVAAISAVMLSLLKAGDHVIALIESYKPTRTIARDHLARFGVECSLVPATDIAAFENAIRPGKTKLILLESPTHVLTRVPDLSAITALAKRHGVLTVLDNTYSGFHNHSRFPCDLFVHSLTKFASGHGDVMGGAILGAKAVLKPVRILAYELGAVLDPHSAFLISRGMKTYFLRYRRQCESAMEIAKFLSGHKSVTRVYYPGLESHPDHARARTQMKDYGAIITFDLKTGNLERFFDALKLFTLAASLGSTESLAAPVLLFYSQGLTESELKSLAISDSTIRLSIGLESPRDLTEDLDRALLSAG